jgi:hypothetical protein
MVHHRPPLAGAISTRLNETIATRGDSGKSSIIAGSYDAMLQFFALYGLINVGSDFYGLPQYASTMVFELFEEHNTKAQAVTMEAAMGQKALYKTVSEFERGVDMQTQMQTGRVSVRSGQQP